MLHFATALTDAGIHVTFLHTDHNLHRLAHATSTHLRFRSIPDGLPDDHPRAVGDVVELDTFPCWPRLPARTVLYSHPCRPQGEMP
ncbi:hypothetical protein PR202_ga27857 [Eleusine coracana subsp. coracana]|uniref:Uncharacterized protein n=1 Tax=Eleusine coracana subsp. coracana TaxID=191504 RepID=A0AAV5DHS1_ELECO|nr:hypothetical protein PR202_ga27857 [Eleusine coracana subsp. coracana]